MSVDVDARQPRTLLTNGAFNRFATVLADRSIVFTSDLSGVDNLYRLREGRSEPEALTNTTTGFWFPTTNRALPTAGLKLYASAYTAQGFELAEIDLASGNRPLESLDAQAVKVERAPAPKVDSPPPLTREGQNQVEYPSSDYSIYPSILPRSWAPVFVADSNNKSSLGGLVSGFDAVDRHRYLLMAYYQNDTHRPDWYALYSNRSFGPTFHLRSQGDFSIVSSDRKLTTREIKSGIAIERPILWTYSSLTPLLGASWNRLSTYKNTIDSEYRSIHITEVTGDAKLTWRDTESSRLAIGPESGTALSAGLRGYFQPKPTSGDRTFKLAGTATQLFRITDHSVLQFKGFAARTNRRPYSIDDLLIFKGRNSSSILMSQGTDYLDSYPLRGYADLNLYAQTAAHGALDLRFPLGRLFRGWGTNPFFIEQLYGFAFYESAYFPANATRSAITLPAWGGGIRLSLEVLVRIPLVASLEYQQGTNSSYNPDQMGFFSLGLGALPF
jgi:hypothetical protein